MTSNRRQGRRDRGAKPAPRRDGDTLRPPLLVALSALIVLELLAGLAPASNWLWGVNLLRYYPPGLAIAWAGLALTLVWWPRRALPPPAADAGAGSRPVSALVAGIFAGLATLLLLNALRSHSHLLGDGYEIIRRLRQDNTPAPRSPFFNALAPGLFRLMGGVGNDGGERAAAWFSILAGAISAIVVVAVAVRLLRRDRAAGPAAMALLLATPLLQIFSGYIESYASFHAGAVLFFAFACDAVLGGGIVALVGATAGLGIALSSHPFATTLLPGWLYLLATPIDAARTRPGLPGVDVRRLRIGVGTLAGVVVVAALIFALWPELRASNSPWRYAAPQELGGLALKLLKNVFHPRPWAERYTIVSLVHLSDLLNTLWLVGAPGLAVVAALLTRAEGRASLRSAPARVMLLAFPLILFGRTFIRTPLGASRDWDAFAGLGLGLNAIAAGALLGLGRSGYLRPVVTAGLFLALPFIGIQMSPDRSARRHFDAVDAPPRPEPFVESGYHGVMGDRFGDLGQYALASRAYSRSLSVYPRRDYAWRLGNVEMAQKNYDRAAAALERALQIDPDFREALTELGNALNGVGAFARADSVLAAAIARYPDRSGLAMVYRARARYAQGDSAGGREWLAAAERTLPPEDVGRVDLKRLKDEVADSTRAGAWPSPAAADRDGRPPTPR